MIDQHASLMITVLCKDYPEIASIITDKISKSLPERSLDDLEHIDQIVASFKSLTNVSELNWAKGKNRIEISENRQQLTAIILLFYHPEKLMQLTTENTRHGVLKKLSCITGSSVEVLCKVVSKVIVAFKAYEYFRSEVYRLYNLIRIENKFFE